MDREQITLRTKRLRDRKSSIAKKSALLNLLPIPGLDILFDLATFIPELEYYLAEFQLTNDALRSSSDEEKIPYEKLANQILFSRDIVLGKIAMREFALWFIKEKGKQLGVKYATKVIPVFGQIFAACASYISMDYMLDELITSCSEDACRLSDFVEHQKNKKSRKRFSRFIECCCCRD